MPLQQPQMFAGLVGRGPADFGDLMHGKIPLHEHIDDPQPHGVGPAP